MTLGCALSARLLGLERRVVQGRSVAITSASAGGPAGQERSGDFVQSLERGLAVICAFSQERPALTLSDAARLTGLSPASARRVLLTLQRLGYVRSDGRQFALTPRALDLGYAYLSSLDLWNVAQVSMQELATRTGESCSAAVLDGADIIYVARVPTRRIMTIAVTVGTRLPASATSMGLVLLAELAPDELDAYLAGAELVRHTPRTVTDPAALRAVLAEVRAQGWAMIDQELEEGVRSIAVPIRDREGKAFAALNVCAHAARVALDRLRCEFLPVLLETASTVSAQIAKRH